MILANVRGRLRAQDFLLVAIALARGDAARRTRYERLLLEQGPDELLDEPDLLAALLALRTLMVPSPALFAYVAVRHTLRAAGVDDRELADYLAALLLEFGDHDRHVRIRRTDDETYHYLVDMVEDLTGLDDAGERAFLLRAHLGNYSLWLAGLFPDYIAARRSLTTSWGDRAFGSPRSTALPNTSASPPSTAPPPSGSRRCGWRSIASVTACSSRTCRLPRRYCGIFDR